ncbi:ribonuclease H2 subunit A-like protein [Leptotrombidium deliense]|uniref:Ribonuclease n=1 Tax=Leptotrombidium deliense TaxID=299467 RepID=A0A443SQJ9_9ACAR|nr:ribonuclease H2 subunit A-like protein [Leptotrombidium deliense]
MDFGVCFKNLNTNSCLRSDVPKLTKKEPCILGIDEAGRGPVLGPMVYSVAYIPASMKGQMKEIGFADSKTLTEEKRTDLFENINSGKISNVQLGWIADVLSPVTISNSMLKRCKYNLNALSHDTAMGLISKVIESGVRVKEVYIDTVGPPEKYKAKVEEKFPQIKVTVAKKADSTYPIVSAASICAKVIRDKIVSEWKFPEGLDHLKTLEYGSGYPSDPTTKEFLKKAFEPVFGFPSFVRFSWSTIKTIMVEKGVECCWEEEEDDNEDVKGNKSILEFFSKNNGDNSDTKKVIKKRKSHRFFTDRCLERVGTFL